MNMNKVVKTEEICGITDNFGNYVSLNKIYEMSLGETIDILTKVNTQILLNGGWNIYLSIPDKEYGDVSVVYTRNETDVEYMMRQEKLKKNNDQELNQLNQMKTKYSKMMDEIKKQEEKIAKYEEYISSKK